MQPGLKPVCKGFLSVACAVRMQSPTRLPPARLGGQVQRRVALLVLAHAAGSMVQKEFHTFVMPAARGMVQGRATWRREGGEGKAFAASSRQGPADDATHRASDRAPPGVARSHATTIQHKRGWRQGSSSSSPARAGNARRNTATLPSPTLPSIGGNSQLRCSPASSASSTTDLETCCSASSSSRCSPSAAAARKPCAALLLLDIVRSAA